MSIRRVFLVLFFALLCFFPAPLFAHVGYVVPAGELETLTGFDSGFFVTVFSDPSLYAVGFAVVVLFFIVYFLFIKIPALRRFEKHVEKRADEYTIFVSWIMRLALGILLVGSGVSGTLISPIVSSTGFVPVLEVLLGFLILTGFLLSPAIVAALLLYVFALTKDPYILGNLEFFALTLSFLVLANGKPGVDDLLGIPSPHFLKKLKPYVPFILRAGVGGAMIYLSLYEKLLNPHLAERVVFLYGLTDIIPVSAALWVFGTGAIEFFIGLAIFLGFKTRLLSLIAFFVLSLSFFYFGETVYSHVTLFSALAILFILDSGRISIDRYYRKK